MLIYWNDTIRDEIFIKMAPEEYMHILYIVIENQLKGVPKKKKN